MGKITVSKVAELRRELGLTQRQLADAVGVTESTISNWEKNRNGIEWFERIARLCKTLKCEPSQLIDYIDPLEEN